jgi:protein-S-isoprenylcysteine O-methyltransferase Ste14
MGLDIRWPIGLMFLVVGLLMVVAGFTVPPEQLQRSLGININLIWGVGLLFFGGLMTFFAWRGSQKNGQNPQGQ